MAAIHLVINNRPHEVEVASDTPLLWVLRDKLNLTGTKALRNNNCSFCGQTIPKLASPLNRWGSKTGAGRQIFRKRNESAVV